MCAENCAPELRAAYHDETTGWLGAIAVTPDCVSSAESNLPSALPTSRIFSAFSASSEILRASWSAAAACSWICSFVSCVCETVPRGESEVSARSRKAATARCVVAIRFVAA